MDKPLRFAGVVLTLLISISCVSRLTLPTPSSDQSSAEAALRSFYGAIEAKDADTVVGLFRAKDGTALSSTQERTMRDGLKRVFAGTPAHVTTVRVDTARPLETEAMNLLPFGTAAVRLTFAVDGTGSACFPLPMQNGTSPFAQLQGRWYILEELQFGFPFTVLNC
jgi:ketosteroid isomerase-like protein